jgi:hypothetical protein
MSRIVFVTWNGGGNLLPALGIGRELDRRGHSVAFLGRTLSGTRSRRRISPSLLTRTGLPGPARRRRQRNGCGC